MTPSPDPDERSYRIRLPPWVERPDAGKDNDDRSEPAETSAQGSAACGATAGDYLGCDGATPSATDNRLLCETHPVPGRSWAHRNTGSGPTGPSAGTLPVPEGACACVSAVLFSKPAVSQWAWRAIALGKYNRRPLEPSIEAQSTGTPFTRRSPRQQLHVDR